MTVSAKYTSISAGIDNEVPVVRLTAEVTDSETGVVTVHTFSITPEQFDGLSDVEAQALVKDQLDARIVMIEEMSAKRTAVQDVVIVKLNPLIGVVRTREGDTIKDVASGIVFGGGKR